MVARISCNSLIDKGVSCALHLLQFLLFPFCAVDSMVCWWELNFGHRLVQAILGMLKPRRLLNHQVQRITGAERHIASRLARATLTHSVGERQLLPINLGLTTLIERTPSLLSIVNYLPAARIPLQRVGCLTVEETLPPVRISMEVGRQACCHDLPTVVFRS